MKTLTCRAMGGTCDAEVSGISEEEMLASGMRHLEEAHPDMAAQVKAASKDDPMMVAWREKFHKTYEAAPKQ